MRQFAALRIAFVSGTVAAMKIIGWVGALAIIVGGLGCGGSSGDGGSCGTVQPCGGSVVGTWKVASTCVLDDSLFASDATDICATATIHVNNISAMGGVTYGAAGTYQDTGSLMFSLQLTVPMSCLATGETCSDLDTGFAQEMQQDMTLTSHSCSTSGTSCVCALAFNEPTTDSGTYSTSGTNLTTTATGSQASTDAYCVEGNTLHDIAVDMSMQTSMGKIKIQGDVVFTKQ
jgi:hypothetical protein